MMGSPTPCIGIVSYGTSFLFPEAGNHITVNINSKIVYANLVKKPVLKDRENFGVSFLGNLLKNRL